LAKAEPYNNWVLKTCYSVLSEQQPEGVILRQGLIDFGY